VKPVTNDSLVKNDIRNNKANLNLTTLQTWKQALFIQNI